MQARYYDPVIGRFYSNDPVGTLGHLDYGNIQGFNRYAYANNNPYGYTDPDGQTAIPLPPPPPIVPPVTPPAGSPPFIPPSVPSGGTPPITLPDIEIPNVADIIITITAEVSDIIQNSEEGGTKTSSTTTWNGDGKERIDVENPNPEAGGGNLHYHDKKNKKYGYDNKTNSFNGLGKKGNKKLRNNKKAQNGIKKAKNILGQG